MARRAFEFKNGKELLEAIYKRITWIYGCWLLGIVFGWIGIRPTGFSAGGLSVTFARPEAIQGMIFLACFAVTVDVLLNFQKSVNPYTRLDLMRNEIEHPFQREEKIARQESWRNSRAKTADQTSD